MKFPVQNLTRFLLITGLVGVTMVEALRPGFVGAATNLGAIIFMSMTLLAFSMQRPSISNRKGE